MKKRFIIWSVLGILFLLMLGIVFAEDENVNGSKRNDFNARLAHINCRVQLTETQLGLLMKINSNLSSHKALLDADYAKLQEFANALNHKEFNKYFTTTFKDNLKNATKDIKESKKNFRKGNLTNDEKKTIKDEHKTAIAEYADCINKADKDWAEARGGYLNSWLNKWKNIISKMKEKGYDTAEMESVISDAETKLLPAIEAVKNASSKEEKKSAKESARNLHLHLWARFESARIKSYLSFIESDAIAKGYESDVTAIKAKLDEASALAVSGKKYKEGEFESVWKVIKDASQMLKELNKKVKRG